MTATTLVPVDLAPRIASFDINAHEVPTGHEEAWRFAPIALLRPFFESMPASSVVAQQTSDRVANRPAADVTSNWLPTDRPSAIALSGAETVVDISIAEEELVTEPIEVRLHAEGDLAYQHVRIGAGRHSRAIVLVTAARGVNVSGALRIEVADGADLTVVVDGQLDADQICHVHVPIALGRDAKCTLVTAAIGGAGARWQPSVQFTGPGAAVNVLGAFLVHGTSRLEQRVFIEHDQPHCSSRVAYKGALAGAGARSVWVGDVLVRAAGVGTDTYELNRNLLLDDGARADSVPNLELETGDIVSAGHASATGRLDDEHLFYLQARGIPPETARQLVVRGFFVDILNAIPDSGIRRELDRRFCAELGLHDSIALEDLENDESDAS